MFAAPVGGVEFFRRERRLSAGRSRPRTLLSLRRLRSMSQDEEAAVAVPTGVQPGTGGSAGAVTVSEVVGDNLAAQQEDVRQRLAKAAAKKVVAHPSVEERQRKGRVALAEVPHEELAGWQPRADRADPV